MIELPQNTQVFTNPITGTHWIAFATKKNRATFLKELIMQHLGRMVSAREVDDINRAAE